jgi:hypothetical protein
MVTGRRGGRFRGMDVVGRIADEGVCGECVGADGRWTIRARLTPWSQVGCAPTFEPLEIVHEGSRDALVELQRRWLPGREVRLRVRPEAVALRARLVAPRV